MTWIRKALKYFGTSIILAFLALLVSLGCGVAVLYGKMNGWWA